MEMPMRRLLSALLLLAAAGDLSAQLATLPFTHSADKEIYRTMVRRLNGTRLTVKWEETGLEEAIRHIARNARINMVILGPVKERSEEPVNLTLSDVSAMTIVKLLRDQFEIEFQHRHGVLVVTSGEDALKKSMVLGIYGIHDVLYTPPDFPSKVRMGLNGSGFQPEEAEEEEAKEPPFDPDFIIDLIRGTTGGDKVWDVEGASIAHHNGKLIVRHAPHIQVRVRRMLRIFR